MLVEKIDMNTLASSSFNDACFSVAFTSSICYFYTNVNVYGVKVEYILSW